MPPLKTDCPKAVVGFQWYEWHCSLERSTIWLILSLTHRTKWKLWDFGFLWRQNRHGKFYGLKLFLMRVVNLNARSACLVMYFFLIWQLQCKQKNMMPLMSNDLAKYVSLQDLLFHGLLIIIHYLNLNTVYVTFLKLGVFWISRKFFFKPG